VGKAVSDGVVVGVVTNMKNVMDRRKGNRKEMREIGDVNIRER